MFFIQHIQNRESQGKCAPRHIVVKLQNIKDKEKILKAARERTDHLQRNTDN